ncbi:MAG: mechanosensitive ion channel family protein [Bacteroides sp.]|nr:mechanosensitive ion channel family protein [Bacteroides sp.]
MVYIVQSIVKWVNETLVSMGINQGTADLLDQYIVLGLVIGIALCIDAVCRPFIVNMVHKVVTKTKVTWDDIIFDKKVVGSAARLIAPIIIYMMIPIIFRHQEDTIRYIHRLCMVYIIATVLRFLSLLITAIYHVYNEKEAYRNHPLKGIQQTAQVLLFFIGGIIIISTLLGKNPTALLTGLSASAAILMLVFKDTIMGFVSGILLSTNNMLKPGDWITMPKYNADGMVTEVTLNTVKVQNWDKTITTIPPYLLVSDSFQNWQGMFDSGGRRVKRSINIDMNSVKFCTPEMLEKYRKIHLLQDYVEETEEVIRRYNEENNIDNSILVNGRRQTNLGIFRSYLTTYLKTHPAVNHSMMTMVRQLQPTGEGIPMELYFFTANTAWVVYEGVQADAFDHILAIMPEFGLRVFQNPSGADFRALTCNKEN